MGASMKTGGGAGGRRGRRKRHQPMGEINVTPFVDVMLVLLIIFMVTAPMMATGVPIDLAKATSKPLDTPKKEPLLVSLDKAGKIYIGQTAYTLEDLGPKLQAIAKERDKDEAVQFSGDQGIDYGLSLKVIGLIKDAGFKKVGLRTDPKAGG